MSDTGASPAKVYNRAQCTAYLKKHIDPQGEVRGTETLMSFRAEAWSGNSLIALVDEPSAPRAWTRLMLRMAEHAVRRNGRPHDT